MKKLIGLIALFMFAAVMSYAAETVSATGTAKAKIIQAATLTHATGAALDFGVLVADSDGGSVVVPAVASPTPTDTGIKRASGNVTSDHFTLVLPDLTYDKGLSDSDYPVLEFVPVANGSEYDASVLSYCYYQARKAGEIAAYLGITDSTYYRKKILDNLVGQGYLIKSKASRAAVYRTNREFARLA